MKSKIIALIIAVFSFNPALALDSRVECLGDATLATMIISAYGMSYLREDMVGQKEYIQSFVTNTTATYALKLTVQEERPDKSNTRSFPSWHTSASFQSATFIQQRFGWRASIPFYLGALFVGYSRVYAKKHYVHDVVAGAVLGTVSSLYFTTPYRNLTITPVVTEASRGVMINYQF